MLLLMKSIIVVELSRLSLMKIYSLITKKLLMTGNFDHLQQHDLKHLHRQHKQEQIDVTRTKAIIPITA